LIQNTKARNQCDQVATFLGLELTVFNRPILQLFNLNPVVYPHVTSLVNNFLILMFIDINYRRHVRIVLHQ